jgi:4-alpha-glucanotransferase
MANAWHRLGVKAFARQIGWKYYKQPTVLQKEQLLWQQMRSNSLFHIELLQDMLPPNLTHSPKDERINFPGTVSDKNWSYCYKLTVEQLVNNPDVSKLIQTILSPTRPESSIFSVQHNDLSFECPTDHLSGYIMGK